jgi:lipoprotein-releasing system permease protein
LSIAAIALSVATMLVSIAIVRGFQREIKNKLTGFNTHIQITRTKINYTFENEPVPFNKTFVNSVKNVPEVKSVNIFATKPCILRAGDHIEGLVLKGVTSDYDWSYLGSVLIRGRLPYLADTTASDDILISRSLATLLDADTGDKVVLHFVQQPPRARKMTICGLFETGIDDIDHVFAVCDLRHIQKINNWPPQMIGGYEVNLTDLKHLEEANARIRPLAAMGEDSRTIREIYPQIFDWLNLLNTNVKIILILMLIVASVNMITALLVIILEKTQFIGIMKSIGAQNASVSRIFVYNASFLIGLGILAGDLLGLLIIFLQSQFQIISLPLESYYVSHIPVFFDWASFVLLNIGTIVFCTLVMFLPARMVARIDPVKTIRFE